MGNDWLWVTTVGPQKSPKKMWFIARYGRHKWVHTRARLGVDQRLEEPGSAVSPRSNNLHKAAQSPNGEACKDRLMCTHQLNYASLTPNPNLSGTRSLSRFKLSRSAVTSLRLKDSGDVRECDVESVALLPKCVALVAHSIWGSVSKLVYSCQ